MLIFIKKYFHSPYRISKYLVPKYLIIPIFLFLLAFSNKITENVKPNDKHELLEKIYIHFDHNFYLVGDDIWFKVYLVNAFTHKLETPSKVVYVDLIDPTNKLVESKIIKMKEGCGEGDFKLPLNLIRGQYIVRGYTNFMRNFDDSFIFRKRLLINSKLSRRKVNQDGLPEKKENRIVESHKIHKGPDLQFFPEGGYLVESLINRIGFKAVGKDGKGINISGIIKDNTGKILGEFRTSKFGLGMFKILPQQGSSYEARIFHMGNYFTYKLPIALQSGVVMEVLDTEGYYKVNLKSSLQNGINKFWFIGRQRNQIMCDIKVTGNKGSILKIPKKILEEGVAQFTLYDNNGRALCERLVFVEKNEKSPKVNLTSSKIVYKKGDQVELEISFPQKRSKGINANMSVVVTEKTALQPNKYDLDIRSHMLLNSDLRGEIEQPGYYFYSDDPQRLKVLDILLMTQGWRKYIYNDSIVQNKSAWKFPYETGISFTGSIKKSDNINKSMAAEVSLTYSNSQETVYDQTMTDDRGRFTLGDYDFMDSTSVIIQAKKVKKNSGASKNINNPNMNFYIDMDSIIFPSSIINTSSFTSYVEFDHSNNSKTTREIDSIFGIQNGVIMLDELVVESSKPKETSRFDNKKSIYRDPSNHLSFDQLRDVMPGQNVLTALNGRIPGVTVSNGRVSIRGAVSLSLATEPLFLLDGMPVSKDAIISIPIENVDFVDVLKGPKAAIYGSTGANGVIAVYLLDESEALAKIGNKERRGIISFFHPGYSQAREFYQPVYKTEESEQNKVDIQPTIYWNPAVTINNQNKTKIYFKLASVSTIYKVVIEGITSNGDAIQSELILKVD